MAPRQPASDSGDLAARLCQDDEHALEDLLRTFGPAVHRVLARKFVPVLREVEIDDVLSIALYRVWCARQRFDASKGSLRLWFFRIAENAARDVLRHGWHKTRRLEIASAAVETLADGSPACDRPESGVPESNGRGATKRNASSPSKTSLALQTAIGEILEALPEAQRRIVLADAQCREGVASSEQLAKELGLSPASVRVYRKRALDTMRAELTRRGMGPPATKTTEGRGESPKARVVK
ncbi:MAG: sigma-70 family RNA polymerase sigma factor [Pirellulaceae bacterium]